MSRVHELGRQVAALQDSDLRALAAAEKAGEGFIRAVRARSRTKRRQPLPVLLVAAIVGVFALAVVAWGTLGSWVAPRPLAVSPAIPVGDIIRAPSATPIPLHFSDGSEVELAAGTEAVIRELTPDGARLELDRGSARISVPHRPATRWSLQAGPYSVQVTGTRFDLAWSPDEQRFSLTLWAGSVRVSSAGSGHSAVEMVAPERLMIDPTGWHLSRAQAKIPTASGPSAAAPAWASGSSVAPQASVSSAATDATPHPPGESWDELASRGEYQSAYEAAQLRGLGSLAQSGTAPQLIALAETCRLSGHGNEGVAVLSRLRARFPGTDEAALAAFQLGRLTGGAQWFRTYLDERPQGALAREASGRLMEALERSGSHAAAKSAAREYLAKYPTGPHAGMAARILGD